MRWRAMCVLVLVGCAGHTATGSDASGTKSDWPVTGTCSGSGSGEDLCAAQTSAQALFDTWAQAQGLGKYSNEVQNWLQGLVDTHPLRLAVLREDIYGTSATHSQF